MNLFILLYVVPCLVLLFFAAAVAYFYGDDDGSVNIAAIAFIPVINLLTAAVGAMALSIMGPLTIVQAGLRWLARRQ